MNFYISNEGELAVKNHENKFYPVDGLTFKNNDIKPFQSSHFGESRYYTEDEPLEIDADGCLDSIGYTAVLVIVFALAVACKFLT